MHQLDPELGCVIGVICLMQMSDGVFFTGLMEMHSIGDLKMLTGNSIQNTSVSEIRFKTRVSARSICLMRRLGNAHRSSHHMSDAETWKCSQKVRFKTRVSARTICLMECYSETSCARGN